MKEYIPIERGGGDLVLIYINRLTLDLEQSIRLIIFSNKKKVFVILFCSLINSE